MTRCRVKWARSLGTPRREQTRFWLRKTDTGWGKYWFPSPPPWQILCAHDVLTLELPKWSKRPIYHFCQLIFRETYKQQFVHSIIEFKVSRVSLMEISGFRSCLQFDVLIGYRSFSRLGGKKFVLESRERFPETHSKPHFPKITFKRKGYSKIIPNFRSSARRIARVLYQNESIQDLTLSYCWLNIAVRYLSNEISRA